MITIKKVLASAIPSQREVAGRGLANYLTPTSSFPREGIAPALAFLRYTIKR